MEVGTGHAGHSGIPKDTPNCCLKATIYYVSCRRGPPSRSSFRLRASRSRFPPSTAEIDGRGDRKSLRERSHSPERKEKERVCEGGGGGEGERDSEERCTGPGTGPGQDQTAINSPLDLSCSTPAIEAPSGYCYLRGMIYQ